MVARALVCLLLGCNGPGRDPADPDDSGADTGDSGADTYIDTDPSPDNDGDRWVDEDDCAPDDPSVHPYATETCNKIDDDCDGTIDNLITGGEAQGYADHDADGWGGVDAAYLNYCDVPDFALSNRAGDCDDADGAVYPGADERCDGVDQDCDGVVDSTDPRYADGDGDGAGDPADVSTDCADPGRVDNADDCDDADARRYAGAVEACDGVDNDCDGTVDDGPWYADADGDGYGAGEAATECTAGHTSVDGDDDDTDATRSPGAAESCNGVDDDGDGRVDEGWTCTACADVTAGFDWYVPDDHATIQAAIDAAASGDRICVRGGLYSEAIDFSGKDLLVYGEDGPAGTVIDATGQGAPVVTFENGESAAAELVGFTLTGGEGHTTWELSIAGYCSASGAPLTHRIDAGGGVYVDGADPTLSDLVIEDITLADRELIGYDDGRGPAVVEHFGLGGALFAASAVVTLERVDVHDTRANQGGAAYLYDGSIVEWSASQLTFDVGGDGAAIYVAARSSLSMTNVAGSSGVGASGAFLGCHQGTLELVNVSAHGAAAGTAVVWSETCDTTILNSIFDSDVADNALYVQTTGTSLALSYTLAWAPSGDSLRVWDGAEVPDGSFIGILDVDPEYRDLGAPLLAGDDDLRLDTASPAIDAGDLDLSALDPDGTTADLGACGGPGGDWW